MTDTELKLRAEVKLRQCAVAGCNEVPSERLERFPEPVWCKPHYDLVSHRIAERDYQDFVSKLQEHGLEGEPIFVSELTPLDERRCCVPHCGNDPVTRYSFEPYKVPGFAPVCKEHSFALNYATQRMNPQRVIYEMDRARKGTKADPHSEGRRNAILALCTKYANRKGKDSIRSICADLQRERVHMLANWVKEGNEKYDLGLQDWDWLVAFQAEKTKVLKKRMERFISNLCRAQVRSFR